MSLPRCLQRSLIPEKANHQPYKGPNKTLWDFVQKVEVVGNQEEVRQRILCAVNFQHTTIDNRKPDSDKQQKFFLGVLYAIPKLCDDKAFHTWYLEEPMFVAGLALQRLESLCHEAETEAVFVIDPSHGHGQDACTLEGTIQPAELKELHGKCFRATLEHWEAQKKTLRRRLAKRGQEEGGTSKRGQEEGGTRINHARDIFDYIKWRQAQPLALQLCKSAYSDACLERICSNIRFGLQPSSDRASRSQVLGRRKSDNDLKSSKIKVARTTTDSSAPPLPQMPSSVLKEKDLCKVGSYANLRSPSVKSGFDLRSSEMETA